MYVLEHKTTTCDTCTHTNKHTCTSVLDIYNNVNSISHIEVAHSRPASLTITVDVHIIIHSGCSTSLVNTSAEHEQTNQTDKQEEGNSSGHMIYVCLCSPVSMMVSPRLLFTQQYCAYSEGGCSSLAMVAVTKKQSVNDYMLLTKISC